MACTGCGSAYANWIHALSLEYGICTTFAYEPSVSTAPSIVPQLHVISALGTVDSSRGAGKATTAASSYSPVSAHAAAPTAADARPPVSDPDDFRAAVQARDPETCPQSRAA